ncbi:MULTISPECIES: hypothetical protein [Burkholderia cepacia complex]|uniref:hypothetical protein n=1 Tax=Burkholderia cepacia complex TaxID=87882 RepID=UPI001B9D84A5|nr:hypothetical protein [Burkholderia cenocepacia]MBR8323776.1 hypothetical protein [Burkholderia cenocepacia]
MTNGTSRKGWRARAAAAEWAKRSAGGTGVMTAALMITAPYLGSCAPDDSGATPAPAPASAPPAGVRHVDERTDPPVQFRVDEAKAPDPVPSPPAFRPTPFAPVRRPAIAVGLDDRLLGGPLAVDGLAGRPPLPNGPLPDERLDLFRPHRGGPVLSYTGAAESLRAQMLDGERLARIASPDLPPLPGVAVQLAGATDSPFYADQVADALARYAASGGTAVHDEAGGVRTASWDGGDASGGGLAGVPFYADQIAYARTHPLPDDVPSLGAGATESVASLVSRFPFDLPGPKRAAPPSIALSTLGGEVAYHALSERRAALIEPRSVTGLLDTLKPILAALPKLATGAVSTVAHDGGVPAEARIGEAGFASRSPSSAHVAGSTRPLDGQWAPMPTMSASLPELATQVASIGGQRQASPEFGARPQRSTAFASREWRVAMRVSTAAVPGAGSGERSQTGRGARAAKNGHASEGLPTIVADTRSVSAYESRALERPTVVAGLPSAVEMAAALVRPETSGRMSTEARASSRIARGAAHADAGRDTGWRAAAMTTVGDQRYGRFRRGDPLYDNVMTSVAAAQHRSVTIDMPPQRPYRDVATSVILASSGPTLDAEQQRAATIGRVF